MQIDNLGANKVVVFTKGYTVLFSYNTPVAYFNGSYYKRTSKFWSVTTSKHISQWLEGIPEERIQYIDQSQIDEIVNKI